MSAESKLKKMYAHKRRLHNTCKYNTLSHTVHSGLETVQCIVQCIVYSVQCTVYSVQCTMYSVQCVV